MPYSPALMSDSRWRSRQQIDHGTRKDIVGKCRIFAPNPTIDWENAEFSRQIPPTVITRRRRLQRVQQFASKWQGKTETEQESVDVTGTASWLRGEPRWSLLRRYLSWKDSLSEAGSGIRGVEKWTPWCWTSHPFL